MMTKVISIDLDNVLCSTAEWFLAYYETYYGKKVAIQEMQYAYFHENDVFDAVQGWDAWKEVFEHFMVTQHDALQPMWWAYESLEMLRALWYTLHVVTGRHTGHVALTHAWVERHFAGLFADIHFSHALTVQEITKGDICQKINATVHIDDFIHFSTSITDVWIPVLIYDKPRNQQTDTVTHPLLHRVEDRASIYAHIHHHHA